MYNDDMSEKEKLEQVIRYYNKSRWYYNLFWKGAKHFGYYPDGILNISAKEASENMQDIVIKNLGLTEGTIVLDAGCGQGIVAAYLAEKTGCKVVGITIVPFELRDAKRLAKKMAVEHLVNFTLMDYSNMTFEDNYFDAIYTMETLSHSTNLERTLKECFRVLKADGKITLHEYAVEEDSKFEKEELLLAEIVSKTVAMHSIKQFRVGNFPLLLEKVGFENIATKDVTNNVLPSVIRVSKFFTILYRLIIKPLDLQHRFPHLTAFAEAPARIKKGLGGYRIFTATKPDK